MSVEFVEQNVVITANQLNPSIVRETWLRGAQVIREDDELMDGCVFTPAFVNIITPRFDLMVLAERLQWTPKGEDLADRDALATERLSGFVRRLAETPYTAIGLNFSYRVTLSGDFPTRCRALFAKDTPLANAFSEPDARFGAYFSQNFGSMRLRLDVKPTSQLRVNLTTGDRQQISAEQLTLNFNFQRELSDENRVEEIAEVLARLETARLHAADLANLVEE
jgi:hypothetical protein